MTDTIPLRPAPANEITTALSSALRHDGRKRVPDVVEVMATIVAEWLVRYLQPGFVIIKASTAAAPTTAAHTPPFVG